MAFMAVFVKLYVTSWM